MTERTLNTYLDSVYKECKGLTKQELIRKCIFLENTLLTVIEMFESLDKKQTNSERKNK